MADQTETNGRKSVGTLLEIKGVVVDAVFTGALPEINNALEIAIPAGEDREAGTLVAEVQQHLGDDRVRAVAMDSTDGLARGLQVTDTGAPISVPSATRPSGGSGTSSATPSTRRTRPRTAASAGRSTVSRRASRISRRPSRSSRRGSRSST